MSYLAWLAERCSRKRLQQATAREISALSQGPIRASRRSAHTLLQTFRAEPGPHVNLGWTDWGEPVIVPLVEFVKACGIITGGMGSGKTMKACLIPSACIKLMPHLRSMAIGILDGKGEGFDRLLYLHYKRCEELDEQAREALLNLPKVTDFSARHAPSSYNLLARWPGAEPDFFVTSRFETLKELLPSGDKLSLRGGVVLKKVLALLSEVGLPLTYLSHVLESDTFRSRLLSRSSNAEVKHYFEHHFRQEGKSTLVALRVRIESLLASESVRLALSGSTAPDFCRWQNEGKSVLIRLAGPSITRGVSQLLQSVVLSDIRQSIFARPTNPAVTYHWFADEAQNFFRSKQQQENMADILTMGRSFGSFFSLICQNLTSAVPDARMLEVIYTNIRWASTLRGTPRDAQFLRSALPVTGRRLRVDPHPFRERTFYSLEEERALLLNEIANLPDRTGYLWFKARSPEAIRIRTRRLEIPEGEEFQETVAALREDSRLGGRVSRREYMRRIEERDREWLETSEESSLMERLEKQYREEQGAWQK